MRRAIALAGAVAALLVSSVSLGQERQPTKIRLSVEPRLGIMVLGFEAPTGGLSAGATAKVLFPMNEEAGLYAGAGADLIGLPGGWYHMGVVAGPRAGAWRRWGAFELGGGLGLLYGQLTTCRLWEVVVRQCMRWWNAWPEASVRASYVGESVRVGVEATALLLPLPWGTTGGGGLAVVGAYR